MDSKTLVNAVLIAVVGSSIAIQAQAAKPKPAMQKCYGIVKAKMNDCGTPQHACAAQAKQSGNSNEWIFLPQGTCTKIVGGSTTAETSTGQK